MPCGGWPLWSLGVRARACVCILCVCVRSVQGCRAIFSDADVVHGMFVCGCLSVPFVHLNWQHNINLLKMYTPAFPTSPKFILQPSTNDLSRGNPTHIELLLSSIFFPGFIQEQSDKTESHENADGWFGFIFLPFNRLFNTFYVSIIKLVLLTFPIGILNIIL